MVAKKVAIELADVVFANIAAIFLSWIFNGDYIRAYKYENETAKYLSVTQNWLKWENYATNWLENRAIVIFLKKYNAFYYEFITEDQSFNLVRCYTLLRHIQVDYFDDISILWATITTCRILNICLRRDIAY